MVNLDKYRDEVEEITSTEESTLSRTVLIEQRNQLLKIFGDMFGVEWLDNGEKKEISEKAVDDEDEIIYRYESEIDEIGSQPAADLPTQELSSQRRRLIKIIEEIDELQNHDDEVTIEDDKPIDDEETAI